MVLIDTKEIKDTIISKGVINMETTENQEMVKIEIEITKEQADFAEFYAKLCGMERDRLIKQAFTTELTKYKTKVLELPLISERQTKTKKNWQI